MLEAAALLAVEQIHDSLPGESGQSSLLDLKKLLLSRVNLLTSQPGIAWMLLSDEAKLTLPEGARNILREVVHTSRQNLMSLLKSAVSEGDLRSDVSLEFLMMTVTGIVKSCVSVRGVHGEADRVNHLAAEDVLDGLFKLLRSSQ